MGMNAEILASVLTHPDGYKVGADIVLGRRNHAVVVVSGPEGSLEMSAETARSIGQILLDKTGDDGGFFDAAAVADMA